MLRATFTALVLLSLSTPALADDGPLRWAWHKIWGDPIPKQAQQVNVTLTSDQRQLPPSPNPYVAPVTIDTGAALAQVERLKFEAQQAEKKKIQEEMQARVSARLTEIRKVDSILYQKSLEKGLPYTFNYEGVSVREKSLKPETSLDTPQSKCMRALSDSIVAMLGAPEYRKYVDDQKITSINFRLFDNRESSRSDKMFGIGVRPFHEKNTAVTQTRQCVSTYADPGKIASEQSDCSEWPTIYGWTNVTHSKTTERSGLTVDGLLDSNGNCVDIRDELLAEMELYTHPDDAKKLDVDQPAIGINDSVVSNATGAKSVGSPGGQGTGTVKAAAGSGRPAG